MSKSISVLTIQEIKIAAKRIGKSFPEKKHAELLDIAAYAITGKKNYYEATQASEKLINSKLNVDNKWTFAEYHNTKPEFKQGDWYFYPDQKAVVFEGEFSPYPLFFDHISNSSKLLDCILQIQKKKWPKNQVQKYKISPTYQVDNFITLIDALCHYYFNNSIQGVFCPGDRPKKVDWETAFKKKNELQTKVDKSKLN